MIYCDPAHKAQRVLVFGMSGTGKSTFQIRTLLGSKADMFFLFDHEGEYARILKRRPCFTTSEILAAIPSRWIIFDPEKMFPGDLATGFDFFCKAAFAISRRHSGRKIFACDELQNWTGTGLCPKGLSLILDTGRKRGLDSNLITQGANSIHNRIKGQTTEAVAFRTQERLALQWLQEKGFNPAEVFDLPDCSFIWRNLKGGQTAKKRLY